MGGRFRILDAPRHADALAAPACQAFPIPAISQLMDALHAAGEDESGAAFVVGRGGGKMQS
jgi:hypothetical protein